MEVLLERHRRLVESAPAEVDRPRLELSSSSSVALELQLTLLIEEGDVTLRATLSELVTQLGKGRERAFDYAQNFAQDSAMLAAEEYAVIANAAAFQISSLRARKSTMVEASVRALADMAAAFDTWLWACVIAALIILGPLGMTVICPGWCHSSCG